MIREYAKFFVNGGLLGIVAWGLQLWIYRMIGDDSATAYTIACALTYAPLVIVNFMIQRAWIFNRPGLFTRFVFANLTIMLLVSLLSPLCREAINLLLGTPWGDRGGFILAALLGSLPSFLVKKFWVFSHQIK